jgi:hypothetical protein
MALSGYISLDEAKDQVVVEHENTTHDDRLNRLLEAAERAAVQFMNIDSLDDLVDSPAQSPATIPEDVKSAILMHVEMEFDRDEKLAEQLLKSFERLLWPHRVGLGI